MIGGRRRAAEVPGAEVPGAAAMSPAAPDLPGDARLDALVTEHYDRLIRLARVVCRDGQDAGDAVQAGLEQAWRHRDALRDAASARPWLDRIVVREAVRISRRHRTWAARLFRLDAEVDWIEPADRSTEPSVERVLLSGAFGRLSAEQRAVVALHLHAGYSVAETAQLVGAPVETVRSRLRLAKERLRHALEEGRR